MAVDARDSLWRNNAPHRQVIRSSPVRLKPLRSFEIRLSGRTLPLVSCCFRISRIVSTYLALLCSWLAPVMANHRPPISLRMFLLVPCTPPLQNSDIPTRFSYHGTYYPPSVTVRIAKAAFSANHPLPLYPVAPSQDTLQLVRCPLVWLFLSVPPGKNPFCRT